MKPFLHVGSAVLDLDGGMPFPWPPPPPGEAL